MRTTESVICCPGCYCHIAGSVTGDPALDGPRSAVIRDSFARLGAELGMRITDAQPDDGSVFSWRECSFCLSPGGGDRHFVVLSGVTL